MKTLEKRILNEFQRDFPLCPEPYAEIAERLGCDEETVLSLIEKLKDNGSISRIGAIFTPNTIGRSTLAAMSVPQNRLEEVAEVVSAQKEINHNYERENVFNLWFVVTASTQAKVQHILKKIHDHTGLEVINLPMLKSYHIDLGFKLK